MAEESVDKYPFLIRPTNESEYGHGQFSNILELQNNPHVLVKELGKASQEAEGINYQDLLAGRKGKQKKGFKWAKSIQEKLDSLETSESGISQYIPKCTLVFGQGKEGKQSCFIVMERVEGDKFPNSKFFTEEYLFQFEQIIHAALDFYRETRDRSPDKFGSFPDVLEFFEGGECQFQNLMVGITKSDPTKRMYLIDNYPFRFFSARKEFILGNSLIDAIDSLDSIIFDDWWASNKKPVDLEDQGFQNFFKRRWGMTIEEMTAKYKNEKTSEGNLRFLQIDFEAYYRKKIWKADESIPWNLIKQRLEQRIKTMFDLKISDTDISFAA